MEIIVPIPDGLENNSSAHIVIKEFKLTENEHQNMMQARRWANIALIGIVFYIILDVVIQMLTPHYSLRQAESDLAVGPYGWIMNINFVVRGLLSAAIILAIYKSMKNIVRPSGHGIFCYLECRLIPPGLFQHRCSKCFSRCQ